MGEYNMMRTAEQTAELLCDAPRPCTQTTFLHDELASMQNATKWASICMNQYSVHASYMHIYAI